jgi:ASC-1-like (ASCH) protein
MQYDFNVQEPYRTFLIQGIKTIEWRLNKGKFAKMKVGDTLKFETWEIFEIKKITSHHDFWEMIETFWKESIIPDAKTNEEAHQVYYRFYTPEDEEKYGVLAVHISLL